MKEIISFFTLAFTSFKLLKNYLDFKKSDYYAPLFFNFIFIFILGLCAFYADFILWEKVLQQNALWDIYLMLNGIALFLLVAIYVATYSISLNHFILYGDNNNSVFERKSLISPFSKDLLKVSSEENLIRNHIRNERIYQYIYNYQIEKFEYIDRESNLYKEVVCQQKNITHRRLFRYNIKIRFYLLMLIGIYFITLITSLFLNLYFLSITIVIAHTLIYILSISFFAKISMTLHRENDKDKVKVMRYVRSFRY